MGLVRTMGGFALVSLGVIGLILPIMPGWVFLVPGLVLLGERYDWARRLVSWAKQKTKASPDS